MVEEAGLHDIKFKLKWFAGPPCGEDGVAEEDCVDEENGSKHCDPSNKSDSSIHHIILNQKISRNIMLISMISDH